MKTKRAYTAKENKIILEEIAKNPGNLQKCFLACSLRINRTPAAIQSQWYTVLSKNNPAIITTSSHKAMVNRKTIFDGKGYKQVRTSIWAKIVQLLSFKL